MTLHVLMLVVSFGLILAGSELFTNGIEWAGERLGVAEAAVGSLLAAVGTALPETFIPAVAILMGRGQPGPHQQVGVGAIVGAPLMLSTVAMLVMGVALVAFRRQRGRTALRIVPQDARRDLGYFIPVFLLLVLAGSLFDLTRDIRHLAALVLLAVYGWYSWTMLRIKRHPESVVEHGLYLESMLSGTPNHPRAWTTAAQVAAGIGAIVIGAREFVVQIVLFSAHAGVSAGVLSLILSPLATELPEKYNSVVWIRRRKDHLALANITGAMVFQACIPVALGVAFTPWRLSNAEILAGAISLLWSAFMYIRVNRHEVTTLALMVGGVGYLAFLIGLGLLGVL